MFIITAEQKDILISVCGELLDTGNGNDAALALRLHQVYTKLTPHVEGVNARSTKLPRERSWWNAQ